VFLRDFDNDGLQQRRVDLETIIKSVLVKYPKSTYDITRKEQYRNMKYVLEQHPIVVENAMEGMRRIQLNPKDGAYIR